MSGTTLAALLALAAGAPSAGAGPPGSWTDVAAAKPVYAASDERISLARSSLGTLHVAYLATGLKVAVVPVTPLGDAGLPADVDVGGRPVLLSHAQEGLRVFAGGTAPAGSGLLTATAPPAGVPWSSFAVASEDITEARAGVVGADGTPWVADVQGRVHRGTSPSDPAVSFTDGSGQNGRLVVDGQSGRVWFAWATGLPYRLAIREADVATGAALGTAAEMPALNGQPVSPSPFATLGVSGRVGAPGIYAVYIDTTDPEAVLLWKRGDAAPVVAGVAVSPRQIALAPALDGSLWISWIDAVGVGRTVVRTRALRADGSLSAVVTLEIPDGASGELHTSAGVERLDILVRVGGKLLHTQLETGSVGPPPPPPPGPGQPPPAPASPAVSGRVTDQFGRALARATVEACPQPSGLCLSTFTDADGRYRIDGIRQGRHLLNGFPPPNTFVAPAVRGPVDVGGGELAGQDLVLRGASKVPKNMFVSGAQINGVPILRRLFPIDLRYRFPVGARDTSIAIYPGDDPEPFIDLTNDIDRSRIFGEPHSVAPRCFSRPLCVLPANTGFTGDRTPQVTDLAGAIIDAADVFWVFPMLPEGSAESPPRDRDGRCQVYWRPSADGGCELDYDPPRPPETCPEGFHPGATGACEPNVVVPAGLDPENPTGAPRPKPRHPFEPVVNTANAVREWFGWLPSNFQFLNARTWTLCPTWRVGAAMFRDCQVTWIDPSGFVRSTAGVGIPGARVVLSRSATSAGPFETVRNGSERMSPLNRRNPDVTDEDGHFGWDVVSGYYKVTASKTGCTDPRRRSRRSVQTASLPVPPPVTDLDIRLRCPPAPRATRAPSVGGKARVGAELRCRRGSWTGRSFRFRYRWSRDGSPIAGATRATLRLGARQRGRRLGCFVTARNTWGVAIRTARPVRVR